MSDFDEDATDNGQLRRFPKYGASPIRSKLIDLLKDGKIGDVLTDEQLAKHCGQETQPGGRGYGALMRAMYFVSKHFDRVWERQREQNSIRCLDPDGIVSTSDRAARHVRRCSSRTKIKLQTIDLNAVLPDQRAGVLSRIVQHAALAQFGRGATQRKIESRNITAPKIDTGQMLESLSQPTRRAAK